jgi:hypothetical protein
MTGQEKGDLLIEVTAYFLGGLAVSYLSLCVAFLHVAPSELCVL